MTITTALLLVIVAWLAFSNGANDNFKGVATLFGSGTASYQRAIWWAMVTTLAGAIVSFFLGAALIKAFSGKGLVSSEALSDPNFLLAVAAAAALTVFLATHIGFPISTTHAIVGALVGAGISTPGGVEYMMLGKTFVLPLLLAPVLAVAITLILYSIFRYVRLRLGINRESCICVGAEESLIEPQQVPGLALQPAPANMIAAADVPAPDVRRVISVNVGHEPGCRRRYDGHVIGINADALINVLHFATAGLVGFARGLQDTAKIVGLLVGASLVGLTDPATLWWGVALVAVFMALGGLLSAGRVAETLGHKITDMNHGQGFTANLVTSGLVIGSALWGWGVSTTHCSVGALFGIGAATGQAHWPMIRQIVLAWVITVPVAASIAFLLGMALVG